MTTTALYEFLDLDKELEHYRCRDDDCVICCAPTAHDVLMQKKKKLVRRSAADKKEEDGNGSRKRKRAAKKPEPVAISKKTTDIDMQPLLPTQSKTLRNRDVTDAVVRCGDNDCVLSKKDRERFYFDKERWLKKKSLSMRDDFIGILVFETTPKNVAFRFRVDGDSKMSTITDLVHLKNNKDLKKDSVLMNIIHGGNEDTKIKLVKKACVVDADAQGANDGDKEEEFFWVKFHGKRKYDDGYLHDHTVTHLAFAAKSADNDSFLFVSRPELYQLIIDKLETNKVITNVASYEDACYRLYKKHINAHKIMMLLKKEDLLELPSTLVLAATKEEETLEPKKNQ